MRGDEEDPLDTEGNQACLCNAYANAANASCWTTRGSFCLPRPQSSLPGCQSWLHGGTLSTCQHDFYLIVRQLLSLLFPGKQKLAMNLQMSWTAHPKELISSFSCPVCFFVLLVTPKGLPSQQIDLFSMALCTAWTEPKTLPVWRQIPCLNNKYFRAVFIWRIGMVWKVWICQWKRYLQSVAGPRYFWAFDLCYQLPWLHGSSLDRTRVDFPFSIGESWSIARSCVDFRISRSVSLDHCCSNTVGFVNHLGRTTGPRHCYSSPPDKLRRTPSSSVSSVSKALAGVSPWDFCSCSENRPKTQENMETGKERQQFCCRCEGHSKQMDRFDASA